MIGYTLQIYYDFSGYTDMAIGLASMMGLRFTENFNNPYIAESIGDFWRRWHISLSSWFRDYVFYPLERLRIPVMDSPSTS
ncbi:MAG: MBOAT family O-acyltransferase [Anaerolineales bacterium]